MKAAKDEMAGRADAHAVSEVAGSAGLVAHVIKHYPLNKLRPIKIRPISKGKAV